MTVTVEISSVVVSCRSKSVEVVLVVSETFFVVLVILLFSSLLEISRIFVKVLKVELAFGVELVTVDVMLIIDCPSVVS